MYTPVALTNIGLLLSVRTAVYSQRTVTAAGVCTPAANEKLPLSSWPPGRPAAAKLRHCLCAAALPPSGATAAKLRHGRQAPLQPAAAAVGAAAAGHQGRQLGFGGLWQYTGIYVYTSIHMTLVCL